MSEEPVDEGNDYASDDNKYSTSPKYTEPDNEQQETPAEGDSGDGETEGQWQAYVDENGQTYYYNATTGASQWTAPASYIPVDGGDVVHADEEEGQGQDETPTSPVAETDVVDAEESNDVAAADDTVNTETVDDANDENPDPDSKSGDWVAYTDAEGREYYYNSTTGETQWERPDSMEPAAIEEEQESAVPSATEEVTEETSSPSATSAFAKDAAMSPSAEVTVEDEDQQKSTPLAQEVEEEKEVAEEKSPAEKALEALKETDAILEPGCVDHVKKVVKSLGNRKGGSEAINNLVAGYHGETAICGLLATWLIDLTGSLPSTQSSKNSAPASVLAQVVGEDPRSRAAASIRGIAEGVVNNLAKKKFNKTEGDNILKLSKAKAAFLQDMLVSDRWRRLLIDLSAANKESAVLMYCLQLISKRGHHREIAERINQSDYFGVFSAMLASELAIMGKISAGDNNSAEGSQSDVSSSIGKDLRRTCTSTSYTYLYALEALEDLVKRANAMEIDDPYIATGMRRAVRKWERIREELEETMVNPSKSGGASGLVGAAALAKKRKVDIALVISDLHQIQRRKVEPSSEMTVPHTNGALQTANLQGTLDSAVESLIRKNGLGMQMDIPLANQLMNISKNGNLNSLDTPTKIDNAGELLVAHPTSVTVLLENLFTQGVARRVGKDEIREKCARLIAHSVLASVRLAKKKKASKEEEAVDESTEDEQSEDEIFKNLIRASKICDTIRNLVSFTAINNVQGVDESSSVGRQLSALSIKSACVAQGVMLWAKQMADDPLFLTSAAYVTLAPSMLSLARIIGTHHPFCREAVLNLAFDYLSHSNPEIPYQKTQALKEKCMRLLLWLSTQGQVLNAFSNVTEKIKKGGSEIDSALLRYFVYGFLDIFRPPFSIPLIRSVGRMLLTKPCVEAVKSSYFMDVKRYELGKVVDNFKLTVNQAEALFASKDDQKLVTALAAVYSNNQ